MNSDLSSSKALVSRLNTDDLDEMPHDARNMVAIVYDVEGECS